MFFHQHPYPPYLTKDTEKIIVGTLPPPRFSTGDLHERDVNFCYGSYHNSLWLFLDKIFNLNLRFDNSEAAILERQQFLNQRKIGVCDIVESCYREKIDASDLGMNQIKLRNLMGYIKAYPNIHTILFTGGNSKNGPEYFLRKQLKEQGISLTKIEDEIPRIHQFNINSEGQPNRLITTVSLTSPSGSANRAIGSMPLYKQLKQRDAKFSTFDFRVMQYREFF
ncbi:MAG: DNA glycosylase [Bacteroidetes bacterium MedPE-SWsnd-G2]|nr:MAG: DNA glycosylase [Bacteroidetes bacterium MedPE-SWsnd-G2]